MIVWVSCCSAGAGGIFQLDTESGEVDLIGDPVWTTGLIRWDENTVLQITDNRGFCGRLVHVQGGEVMDEIRLHPHMAYHDAFRLSPSMVALTSVRRSGLDIYDEKLRFVAAWPPIVADADKVRDACHFNSFWQDGNKLYGCAFALGNVEGGWRERCEGTGVFFAFEVGTGGVTLEVLGGGLSQPYTVRVRDKFATVCDSILGELVIYRQRGRDRVWYEKTRFPVRTLSGQRGFLRGCAWVDGGYLVGLSANRHPEVYEVGKPFDVERAHVVFIDGRGQVWGAWPIPTFEIYDVLVISK